MQQYCSEEGKRDLRELAPQYYAVDSQNAQPWRDVKDDVMDRIFQRMETGMSWREATFSEVQHNKWLSNIVLSPARSLFLDLFDFRGDETVLDLGSGWGQLSIPLAKRVGTVISVEPTKPRLDFTYHVAQQESLDNVICLLGDAYSLPFAPDSFDAVFMVGVYEWLATGELEGEVESLQRQALENVRRLLRSDGRLVIAIENRVGMKYLLGERDDHSKKRHVSYLPFAEADAQYQAEMQRPLRPRTYDRFEYEATLQSLGFQNVEIHLAFPDYKLPQMIVPADSETALQAVLKSMSAPDEHDGTNGSRSHLTEPLKRIYRALAPTGVVPLIAPSFVISARK